MALDQLKNSPESLISSTSLPSVKGDDQRAAHSAGQPGWDSNAFGCSTQMAVGQNHMVCLCWGRLCHVSAIFVKGFCSMANVWFVSEEDTTFLCRDWTPGWVLRLIYFFCWPDTPLLHCEMYHAVSISFKMQHKNIQKTFRYRIMLFFFIFLFVRSNQKSQAEPTPEAWDGLLASESPCRPVWCKSGGSTRYIVVPHVINKTLKWKKGTTKTGGL